MITTFDLRGGYRVTAFPVSDGGVIFETQNADGEVISTVTRKGPEARSLLASLSMISKGVGHGAA